MRRWALLVAMVPGGARADCTTSDLVAMAAYCVADPPPASYDTDHLGPLCGSGCMIKRLACIHNPDICNYPGMTCPADPTGGGREVVSTLSGGQAVSMGPLEFVCVLGCGSNWSPVKASYQDPSGVCCDAGANCAPGYMPTSCSSACAALVNPIWASCGPLIVASVGSHQGAEGARAVNNFGSACARAGPTPPPPPGPPPPGPPTPGPPTPGPPTPGPPTPGPPTPGPSPDGRGGGGGDASSSNGLSYVIFETVGGAVLAVLMAGIVCCCILSKQKRSVQAANTATLLGDGGIRRGAV
jgi:hypothetical protein